MNPLEILGPTIDYKAIYVERSDGDYDLAAVFYVPFREYQFDDCVASLNAEGESLRIIDVADLNDLTDVLEAVVEGEQWFDITNDGECIPLGLHADYDHAFEHQTNQSLHVVSYSHLQSLYENIGRHL